VDGPLTSTLLKSSRLHAGIVQHLSCHIVKSSFGTKVSSKISKISAEEVRRSKAQLHGPSVEGGSYQN
jgi:hypothetical protein